MTYQKLLGIPFVDKGRTLEGFDCWGLVRHIHLEKFGEELPDFKYQLAEDNANTLYFLEQTSGPTWELSDPQEGAVVVFKIAGVIRHAGWMINEHQFIHVLKETCVTIESLNSPVWSNRVAGHYRFTK